MYASKENSEKPHTDLSGSLLTHLFQVTQKPSKIQSDAAEAAKAERCGSMSRCKARYSLSQAEAEEARDPLSKSLSLGKEYKKGPLKVITQ